MGTHLEDRSVGTVLPTAGIDTEEDEEQEGEAPEGGASVAEEREGDTDYGAKADDHTYIYGYMEDEE